MWLTSGRTVTGYVDSELVSGDMRDITAMNRGLSIDFQNRTLCRIDILKGSAWCLSDMPGMI